MALFVPFRALGLVTEDVPFTTQRLGKETFVTVSVGTCWQVRDTMIDWPHIRGQCKHPVDERVNEWLDE